MVVHLQENWLHHQTDEAYVAENLSPVSSVHGVVSLFFHHGTARKARRQVLH